MMELSVIENDHIEVKKYLENFVPDNYYRVLGDAYLYQVRAVLQHAVRNAGEYNVRYDSLINSLTAQFEQNRVNIGQEISAWGNKHTVHAQRLTYLEAENNTVSASITELEKIIISNNKAILEKTNKLAAQLVDFEVGGVNLIHNSTFAKGYKAVGDVAITTSDHVLGTLFKIVNLADVEEEIGIGSLVEFNKIKLMEGKQYTLSFYGFGSVELINSIKLNKGDLVHTLDPIIMDSDISNRKTLTFIAPFSGDDIGFSIGTLGYPIDSWFSLVAVQLELGSRATDWSPSPFDNADYIARVAASLEEVRKITIEQQKVNVAAIDTLRANIGETKGQISNEREINLTKFSSMTRQLDELTSTTAGNTSRITNLDNTYTDKFTANAEKLVELEANIGASNAAITRVDEVVATNTSAIATSTNNLSAKIDGIKIGGRNLIRNSTFKLGHEAWGDATITRKDTVLGSEVTVTNNGSAQFGIQNDVLFHTISLVEGDEYTLSFYGNGNIPSINSIWLKSEGNDPQLLSEIAIDEVLAEKKVLTFTSTITADNVSIIIAAAGYPKDSWFKIVALQLEKGNKATDWTEAPEDIVNFISGVEANINEFKEVQVGINGATATQLNTLNTKTDKSSAAIDELRETTSNIEGSTATLETKLRGEYTSAVSTAKSDITKATDGKIDAVKVTLREMTTDISSKADITRVDSVENNAKQSLATAKTELTSSYTSAISTVRTDSATDATNKANKAKTDANTYTDGKVTTLTTLVDSKANISRVDDVENNANKALASTKSELTTDYTKSISKAVGDIEIGGRNLLEASENYDIDSELFLGSTSLKWNQPLYYVLSSQNKILINLPEEKLDSGVEYTFSVSVQRTGQPAQIYLKYGDLIVNKTAIVENESQISITFIKSELISTLEIYALTSAAVLVRKFKLEKGNKASDWTPAPEDVTGYIDSEIDKVTTKIDSKADISRVDSIESNAMQSIAQAKTDLTSSYTSAISTAKGQSATDAQNKANKALADANSIAATKASEAQEAAETYALAKAKAEADAALALAKGDATSKSDAAKSAAIAAAALDAKNKADKALADAKLDATAKADAAKLYAKGLVDTLTTVVNSKADITRVDKVVNDSTQALAQAKTDITGAYTLAITESSELSAADAQTKADKALADAAIKATAAQTAAETYALAQANAKAAAALDSAKSDATTKANKAKADAELAAALDAKKKADEALRLAKLDATAKADAVKDMVVSLTKVVDSKASISRVDDIENNATQALATAKTELTSNYTTAITTAKNQSATDAKTKADAALAAAKIDAQDKANAAKTAAETYALAEAKAKADAALVLAKSDATTKANAAKSAAEANAALDAKNKADKALADAKIDATAKANAAKTYADGIVKTLKTTVDSKATIAQLNTVKNDANQALATAKTELTGSYTKAIEDIEVGGRNFVLESHKELSRNTRLRYAVSNDILRLAGKEVTISLDIKSTTSESGNVYIMELPSRYVTSQTDIDGFTNDWKRFSVVVTANSDISDLTDLTLTLASGSDVSIRNVKAEKGNKATDWTPAPEDVTNYVDTSVSTLKTLVDSKASISRVDTVENTAAQALASAKTELTGSYTSAIATAKSQSATDAQTKATKALNDAKADTVLKANAAQTAAQAYALAEAKAKADAALVTAKSDSTTKANAAESAAKVAAALDAKNKADKALADAKIDSKAKADEAERLAKAHADTKVTALTKIVDSKASITSVEKVANDATQAIATTNTNLNTKFNEAKDYSDLKSGVLVISSNTKKFINPASYSVDTATITGYLVIETPITPARMVNLKLSGFNYSGSSTVGLNLSFYNYTGSFINTGYESTGRYTIGKVQLAKKDADKKAVIIIGLPTSTWNYPKLVLEEVIVGYGSSPDSYLNEFSISVKTDISGYTNLTNVSGVDLQGALQENSAAISTEAKARSDADTALGTRITTLDTDYKGNKTAIRNELTAVSNKTNSTATSLGTLTTTVGGNTTKISQESTARSTADTALGKRITDTDAIAKNAQSRVGTAETAISNANKAVATLRTDLTASYTVQDTRATNELPSYYYTNYPRQTVREFKQKSTMTGVVGAGTYVYLETVVRWSSVSGGAIVQTAVTDDNRIYIRTSSSATVWRAWVEQEDVTGSAAKVEAARKALDTKINTTDARVTAEKKVAADATSAVAKTVGTLTTTVNGHTSTINETKTSLNGIAAKWAMETNVNGKVSGIYQHSTGKKSGLDIITDKFTLSNGTTAGIAPFRLEGSTTYLNMAVIKDASITTAKIDNLAVTSAKIGKAQVDSLQIKGNAVSIPVYYNNPNQVLIPKEQFNTWVTVGTAVLSSNESSTSLSLGIGLIKGQQKNGDNPGKSKYLIVAIFRNGVSLREWKLISHNPAVGWTGWEHEPLYLPSILDTVITTSKVTYEVRVKGENFLYNSGSYATGTIQVSDVTLIAMGMKR